MNKFKVDDTVKTSLGYGVVHEVSENGMRYLIDDDTDFGWFAEKDIELIDRKDSLT
jgi:hypothetical protein